MAISRIPFSPRPVNTVQRYPMLSADEVRLVGFDADGRRRYELTCARDDADDAEVALLRLLRETHPVALLHIV